MFYWRKLARPERLELPTLWFEDIQYKTLGAAAGVAYRRAIYLALELDRRWTEMANSKVADARFE